MAKNSVSDWDTTAANNTDIGGLALSNSTLITSIDNIVQTLMAQLKGAVAYVPRIQVFNSSGTYTPHANMIYAIMEAVGSGGAGGGVDGDTGGVFTGGGGGAGSYARKVVSAATVGASQTVTIGAAGAGVSGGTGGNGGDVSVGSLLTAKGGSGGTGTVAGVGYGAGGLGGVAGTGDVTTTGEPGEGSINNVGSLNAIFCAPNGGSSIFGGGGRGALVNTSGGALAGTNATSYGSGGSGASAYNTTDAAAGGNGSAGIVIITEFCSA